MTPAVRSPPIALNFARSERGTGVRNNFSLRGKSISNSFRRYIRFYTFSLHSFARTRGEMNSVFQFIVSISLMYLYATLKFVTSKQETYHLFPALTVYK